MIAGAPPRAATMRIIVFMWDFFGGGAERVAVTLANAFRAADHEVCIVVGRDRGPNRVLVRDDVPVLSPGSPSPGAVLSHLRAVIAAWRPEVVLSHQTTRNVLAILAHLSSSGRRTRLMVGVEHGEMAFTASQTRGVGLKAFFQLARLLYPWASGIVAVSDNVAESIQKHLRPLRLHPQVLPNPVVFPGFHERAAEMPVHSLLIEKIGPVFVAVGRLEDQKNYSLLLKAFRILIRTVPARLIIFGVGKLQGVLEAERATLGLEQSVDLAGYVENPFAVMRAADALVLSSIWEGLPTVAIEAIACGTQVVSTDNSQGIHHILENGRFGWITPPDSAPALAAAMAEALRAPKNPADLKRQSKAFEAAPVAEAYLAYFKGLAEKRSDSLRP